MKILQAQKTEILNGMLDMLDPEAVENYEEVKNVYGRDLINHYEVYKTQSGEVVQPGKVYSLKTSATRPVNHKQKICQIIADASTQDEWENRLAEYLTKYAKDPAAVVRSIPAHLSIKNIKQNDN